MAHQTARVGCRNACLIMPIRANASRHPRAFRLPLPHPRPTLTRSIKTASSTLRRVLREYIPTAHGCECTRMGALDLIVIKRRLSDVALARRTARSGQCTCAHQTLHCVLHVAFHCSEIRNFSGDAPVSKFTTSGLDGRSAASATRQARRKNTQPAVVSGSPFGITAHSSSNLRNSRSEVTIFSPAMISPGRPQAVLLEQSTRIFRPSIAFFFCQ